MAYSTPKVWSHGDTVSHTDMQKYSDCLDYIHNILGDALRNFPAAHARPSIDHDHHAMVHRYRWLQFQSDGELVDPANSANTISLNEEAEPTTLDLRTVSWLYPGKVYFVRTCTWCREVRKL